jgi:hypothetical protein
MLAIRIFVESKSQTLQGADMDTIGHPQCTQTNATNWGSGPLGASASGLSHEEQILLDAASRAAEKLGFPIDVVDVAEYGVLKKLRSRGKIPRIEIGEIILTGLPTSDEIIASCQEIVH